MATVVRRTIRSTPFRDAISTWAKIVDLLTKEEKGARSELESVNGVASSILSERVCDQSAIIVTCDGPRTRIYCLFDDDALDESSSNESELSYNPLHGDWTISLPCPKEDVDWVQSALAKKSDRISARDADENISSGSNHNEASTSLEIDKDAFLNS